MNAELVLFGKRVDMARRTRRRALVIAVYVTLAVLIALLWYFTHWRGAGLYVFWAAILACKLFFGGRYRGGLVKPFQYRRSAHAEAAPPLWALKMHMYKPMLQSDEEQYRSDERELHQRDRAHYKAYQWLGLCVLVSWFLASLGIAHPGLAPLPGMTAEHLCCGFGLVSILLFVTLPQAILLWTEPDMDSDFSTV